MRIETNISAPALVIGFAMTAAAAAAGWWVGRIRRTHGAFVEGFLNGVENSLDQVGVDFFTEDDE